MLYSGFWLMNDKTNIHSQLNKNIFWKWFQQYWSSAIIVIAVPRIPYSHRIINKTL